VVFIHNGILFSHKEEWNAVIHKKMDGTVEHYKSSNIIGHGSYTTLSGRPHMGGIGKGKET
jgi:hypothetical protein